MVDISKGDKSMKVGIPKGLLYYKYHPFMETFFLELGADIIVSEDTNKEILNEGVKCCVDEACLPIKVFHGHVASIKDKCDILFIPRIMRIRENEFICPKFCGLPEMVVNSIPAMPEIIGVPMYADSEKNLRKWALKAGRRITPNILKIEKAFNKALIAQKQLKVGIKDEGYKKNVLLIGHPYSIYDEYINMNLVKKLNKLGVGVITEEHIEDEHKEVEVNKLYKKPFWSFVRDSYGTALHISKKEKIDGIIYLSSFACGIDSVIIELIQHNNLDIPMLILKTDEHSGEAGFDTRIEAFVDMMERRNKIEGNISAHG